MTGQDLDNYARLIATLKDRFARLDDREVWVDVEAVACDDNGVASFDLIRHHRANERIFLYAFDLIEVNGDDLRRDPLEVRKATLACIAAKASPSRPSVKVNDLAGRRSRTSWLSESEQLWRAA
jgi:ATP-dependent DNA ligase